MVIKHLHDDLKTLHRVFLVNKFCFKIVVSLIYHNPVQEWTNEGKWILDRNLKPLRQDPAT